MLHIWLIPALIIFAVVVAMLYLVMKHVGGSGVRSQGKTIVDEPVDESDPPPG